MKNRISLVAFWLIVVAFIFTRISFPHDKPLKITTWDAFGYYMYLPSILIYHDYKTLSWLEEKDKKYELTGGDGWQAHMTENGNYVFKYLGGIAILEIPFFIIGHVSAKILGYPQDGFSVPYQYALAYGIIGYCIIAIWVLRKILLRYFNDIIVTITLLLLCLATNFIQYAAVDGGMSHAYLFMLYVFVIYTTKQWHKKPRIIWAVFTGYIIGLATICRPTEAIMLIIPILWSTQNSNAAKEKWQMVKVHRSHVLVASLFGLLGILPQIIYWKLSSGNFIYDVGSKWVFLNPNFRVLFGWEKGWFIYTPVTVFFILGLFYLKNLPFKKSVLWFCILNIWIIISWSDWRYGASYSTRALVESYPVFAFPLAKFVRRIFQSKWFIVFNFIAGFLIFANLFQVWQYNHNVLHFNDMNRSYYSHIYLNPAPTPLDFSLLDNQEFLNNEEAYQSSTIYERKKVFIFYSNQPVIDEIISVENSKNCWIKLETGIYAPNHLWHSNLVCELDNGDSLKKGFVRLFRPLIEIDSANKYVFYMKNTTAKNGKLKIKIWVESNDFFEGKMVRFSVKLLSKN